MKLKLFFLIIFLLIDHVVSHAQDLEIGTPANLTECFESPTDGFDLTLNDENVLDGLSSDLYTIYYFDNQIDSNNNQIANAISNPSNYSIGSFGLGQVWVNVVEDADETNFGTATFLLISNREPIANSPGLSSLSGDFYVNDCDAGDSYDLTQNDANVIGSQQGNFIVTYFENLSDANNNINAIQNPENFPIDIANGPVQKFFLVARIEFDDATDCFDTAIFELNTYQQQEGDVEVVDLEVCSDSSGLVFVDFDDALLINNSDLPIIPNFTDFTIVDDGGNTFTNIFNDENQVSLTTYNPFTVEVSYVVGLDITEFSFDNCIFTETFTVFPSFTPQVEDINDIIACSSDDEEITFDLTQNTPLAIGNQTGNFNVSYHFTLSDANANINSVTDSGFDPSAFTLDNFQGFLFLRIENADQPNCFSVDFFTLQDAGNLIANTPQNTQFCSLPGEGTLSIDLTAFDDAIKGSQINNDLVVDYFENGVLIDDPSDFLLQNETTSITASLSLFNIENCSDEVVFDVLLFQSPEIQNLNDLEVCSDFDLTSTFNLTQNIPEAIGTQDETEIGVSFFMSLADAENNQNSLEEQGIDITEYSVSDETETIFIRLQNQSSASCSVVGSFELLSFPTEINEVADLVQCTEEGVASAIFDLTQVENDLFPAEAEASDFSVTYFDENDIEIIDSSAYEITSAETISVEITNLNNSQCLASTSFNLSFDVTPEIQNLNDLEVCSDFDLTSTFNLTQNIPEAIGTQDETEIGVSFFTSLADAENNQNSLEEQGLDITEYSVSSETETIFIRLQNQSSASCSVVGSFELLSFPVEVNPVENLSECLNVDTGVASFDLSAIPILVSGGSENLSELEVKVFNENNDLLDISQVYETANDESLLIEVSNFVKPDCFATTSVFLEVLPEGDEACTLSTITEENLAFKVYPNPFANSLNISSQQPITQVTIFDIQGKKVLEKQANNLRKLNLNNFASGLYFAQFQSGKVILIRKIIKL